jgi:CBS domain-containing protein
VWLQLFLELLELQLDLFDLALQPMILTRLIGLLLRASELQPSLLESVGESFDAFPDSSVHPSSPTRAGTVGIPYLASQTSCAGGLLKAEIPWKPRPMSQPIISARPETSLDECCKLMEESQVRRIPFTDDSGKGREDGVPSRHCLVRTGRGNGRAS